MPRLHGKVCVITGAASGIGRATAERFAAEGARLVLTDIQEAPLLALAETLRTSGADVAAVIGDVSLVDDARAMIQAALDRFGTLDILVANAGIIPLGDILESDVAIWDQVMAVDGQGMWLTCKYAIEALQETGGAIVCVSSISGVEGQRRQSTYGPAKFVASGITKHLAVEWADRGIRVNAVAPGATEAPPRRIPRNSAPRSGEEEVWYKQIYDQSVASSLMKRYGTVDEQAGAILFLASDDASFVTGVILPVDGGYLAQ
jgi:NAD(P)-dependent dehydrogenase (short-subunit alcohol dehydrogenase family)